MTALPIKGYAREYGSAAEMLAAYRARQSLPWKQAAKPDEPAQAVMRPGREAPAGRETSARQAESRETGKHEAGKCEVDLSLPETRPDAVPWAVVRRQYRLFHASMPPRGKARAGEIIAAVAAETGIAVDAIKGEQRVAPIAQARQLAIWRVAGETELSLSEIGRLFHRDHTTVLHAIRVINQRRGADVRSYGGVPAARTEGKRSANQASPNKASPNKALAGRKPAGGTAVAP